jgi:hypothetical protein
MLSCCHLRQLIHVGLARRHERGQDAAPLLGDLIAMGAGNLAQETLPSPRRFAVSPARPFAFWLRLRRALISVVHQMPN